MTYIDVLSEMDKLSSDICDFQNAIDGVPVESKDWFLRCMFNHFQKTFQNLSDLIDRDFLESIESQIGNEYRDKYKIGLQLEVEKEKLLVG